MEVLVTGGDTDLGRTIAESFRDAGHRVVISGSRRDDLEVAAKELDVDAIVCDNTDAASLEEARTLFPHHLDAIVNVPAPLWDSGDPRTYTLADHATAWRNALDATMLSTVLTVQVVGDHLRSGGTIISRRTGEPARRQRRRRDQGRGVELDRGPGHALRHPRNNRQRRGIRPQRAAGLRRSWQLSAGGSGDRTPGLVLEHTCRAPHHRADDARQQRCARQSGLIFPRSPEAKAG